MSFSIARILFTIQLYSFIHLEQVLALEYTLQVTLHSYDPNKISINIEKENELPIYRKWWWCWKVRAILPNKLIAKLLSNLTVLHICLLCNAYIMYHCNHTSSMDTTQPYGLCSTNNQTVN